MTTLREGAARWLDAANARVAQMTVRPRIEAIGRVVTIGDGVATVRGLPRTRLDERLRLADGTEGLAVRIDENEVGCVLLADTPTAAAGNEVRGMGDVLRVPVGDQLLGRVVDPLGCPLDGGPPIHADVQAPIERPAPGIVDRALVNETLATGITVIDAMVPLGRGQRELIVGDRTTGKTAIAVDTIINQRDSDVVCVYAAIGQKSSSVAEVVQALREHGRFERCIVVVGAAEAPPGAQWVTPYAACTMAEFFRDRGGHALLVLDDLTKHAIIYRQLSLLLRQPPGREAYPGDVFYLHARLLERAAKLADKLGGGSLSALPIAETQSGNLTAYIPTNLISITDGQVYLEPKLFYEGQKPAVNVGLSVSRVGSKTQPPAVAALAARLKLDYAQFLELESFTRFGASLDARTKRQLARGERIRSILRQPRLRPLSLATQTALLLAVAEGRLDELPLDRVADFRDALPDALARHCAGVVHRLQTSGDLEQEDRAALLATIDAWLEGAR